MFSLSKYLAWDANNDFIIECYSARWQHGHKFSMPCRSCYCLSRADRQSSLGKTSTYKLYDELEIWPRSSKICIEDWRTATFSSYWACTASHTDEHLNKTVEFTALKVAMTYLLGGECVSTKIDKAWRWPWSPWMWIVLTLRWQSQHSTCNSWVFRE